MNPLPRTLGRSAYFWWGFGLMAVKYNLDRAIAWFGFQHPWYFWNYLEPHGFAAIDAVPPQEQGFYLALLVTALPFLGLGLFLTVLRLRSIGASPLFCLLFFVPVLNLIFFTLLCVLPLRRTELPAPIMPDPHAPSDSVWRSLLSVGGIGVAGLGLAWFSTGALQNYGWGLFVALPFAMGLVSVLIYAGKQPRSRTECLAISVLPMVVCGAGLLLLAAEGMICLIMAAPIAVMLSLAGGSIGYLIVNRRNGPLSPAAMSLVLLSVPFTMGMEQRAELQPPLLSVTSRVIVDAAPEAVWPNVVAFSPIPSERDWILHTGVAYPTSARIDGQGVGAIRHCIFTTGEFVEPVTVWEEGHLLAFSVSAQPEPMEELSPYPRLRTPHLQGYLESHRGEIRLTPLPGGKTLLEGTTWYTDRIWPSAYWQLWSDLLIHSIHLRVLNHIKNLSEHGTSGGTS